MSTTFSSLYVYGIFFQLSSCPQVTPKLIVGSGKSRTYMRFYACSDYLQVWWRSNENEGAIMSTTFSPLYAYGKMFRCSRAVYSKAIRPIWPKIKLVQDFMSFLVNSKTKKILLKRRCYRVHNIFSISVADPDYFVSMGILGGKLGKLIKSNPPQQIWTPVPKFLDPSLRLGYCDRYCESIRYGCWVQQV